MCQSMSSTCRPLPPATHSSGVVLCCCDESRPMLQRIYGTAWQTAEQLAEHQRLVEEAKR